MIPLLIPCLALSASATEGDLAACMPTLASWTKKDSSRFTPDNLFEYINGAADGFLDCGFKELLTQTYEGPDKRLVTVEIYRHESPLTAFGIYSQERPTQGTFLPLGGQGYVEEGILNFFKGDCYIKISGNNLGPKGRDILQAFGTSTAAQISGEGRLPAILDAFPKEGRVPNSERFLLKQVLGYAFLKSGFVVDYGTGAGAYKLVALVGKDETEAGAMVAAYCQAQGQPVPPSGRALTLKDKFHGSVTLLGVGRHLLMALGGEPARREALLGGMAAVLKK